MFDLLGAALIFILCFIRITLVNKMPSFCNSFFYGHLENIAKVLCKSVMETRLLNCLNNLLCFS